MATRFYLSTVATDLTSPAYAAGWEQTASPAFRGHANHWKIKSTFRTVQITNSVAAANRDILFGQFISRPLKNAITISGTIKGIIRASESNGGNDDRAQMIVRVFDGSLSTVRGTLLDFDASAIVSEFDATTLTNRRFPLNWAGAGTAMTSVAAQAGDVLVFEVGYRHHVASSSTFSAIQIGDEHASDLTEDEIRTDPYTPWIEISDNLVFMEDSYLTRHTQPLVQNRVLGGVNYTQTLFSDRDRSIEVSRVDLSSLTRHTRPLVQSQVPGGENYTQTLSAENSSVEEINDVVLTTRLRPSSASYGETFGSGGGGVPPVGGGGGSTNIYKMRAYKTSVPTGYVFWDSPNVPDVAGSSSGYSWSELTNIVVIGIDQTG